MYFEKTYSKRKMLWGVGKNKY